MGYTHHHDKLHQVKLEALLYIYMFYDVKFDKGV